MGNTNTKESRASGQIDGSSDSRRQDGGRSRLRISRGDLGGLLSLQPARDHGRERPDAPFEHRETRQEREARKLEKERANRAKEREQSVREEHVDGGYLVTMGVYTGTEDFSKQVVRQLQIERKLAPFWRGLNEWSGNWTEHQLIAAARGLPIPPADAPPDPDLVPRPIDRRDTSNSQHSQNLTVPMGPRTLSAASDRSGYMPGSATAAPSKTSSIKPRAKALAAALNVGPRTPSVTDLTPKEVLLPHDPHVNGQPIEAFLYKDASDCPICFLSYPPYLNRTRCCDQPICSECFVQIKRADPHLPEHHPNGDVRDPTEVLGPEDPPEMLISEPSACPYCQQAECGVTYEPPPFRRGLVFSAVTPTPASATAMSSQSSLSSTISPPAQQQGGRRRTHSLSASAPNVITTDRVRPDWATKLASARSHQARRAAAATALHTAAFVVGTQETRSILRSGRFGRRSTGPSTPGNEQLVPNSSHTGAADPGPDADAGVDEHGNPTRTAEGGRRSRVEELEDMMFMEAVRLSLAAEEDRKRKEEKALRKEAKKRQSAEKKALKLASKNPYGGNVSGASGSSLSLRLGRRRGNSGASTLRAEAAGQLAQTEASSNSETDKRADHAAGKGKGVDRGPLGSSSGEASSTAGSLAIPVGDSRGSSSHLRQTSNASSFMSSVPDTPSGSYTGPGSTFPRANRADSTSSRPDEEHDSGTEPLFNFRSLAELVGVNLDDGSTQPAGTLRADGIGGGNAKETAAGRPLSQVKEDEKEGAKTEHVESSETTQPLEETTQRDRPGRLLTGESTLVDSDDNNGLSPQVTLTPGTPLAIEEVASGESKQLRSRITEHPADLSH